MSLLAVYDVGAVEGRELFLRAMVVAISSVRGLNGGASLYPRWMTASDSTEEMISVELSPMSSQ